MRTLIPLEEAQTILLNGVQPLGTEKVDLMQAVGRNLGEDIISGMNLPPFDRSPLDGYSLRAVDTIGASHESPVALQVIEEVPAGHVAHYVVRQGTAIKVMTGAPIPSGADVVIRYEDTRREGDRVFIFNSLKPLANICFAGEDVKKDDIVLTRGRRLNYGAVGVLASLGFSQVPVFKSPQVAIISTGDELVDLGRPLGNGKIYNSNSYSLAAAVTEAGGKPSILPTVPDRVESITQRVKEGLRESQLVITSGGVSAGDYDVVMDAFREAGADILFWKVDIRPGTPVVCARKEEKYLIGLSGNPAAALITFELLVRPLIRKMAGSSFLYRKQVKAPLVGGFHKSSPQRRILRATQVWDENGLTLRLAGKQNPGVIRSIVECDALVDIPQGSGPLAPGAVVSALLLD